MPSIWTKAGRDGLLARAQNVGAQSRTQITLQMTWIVPTVSNKIKTDKDKSTIIFIIIL
jgi:hypothetical protein